MPLDLNSHKVSVLVTFPVYSSQKKMLRRINTFLKEEPAKICINEKSSSAAKWLQTKNKNSLKHLPDHNTCFLSFDITFVSPLSILK